MGKSCGQHDFFSLGGQYYSLGQSNDSHEVSRLTQAHGNGKDGWTNKLLCWNSHVQL